MPRRKHKKYNKPRRPFDKARIEEENLLIKSYGLKNKREIWKADSAIGKMRKQAKLLLTEDIEKQNKFIEKLRKQGFAVKSIADVLALEKEDYLKRRLQSIVFKKGIARTSKQARQFIAHKNIAVDNKIINIPSYIVPIDEEDKITLKLVQKPKEKKKLGVIEKEGAEGKSEEAENGE